MPGLLFRDPVILDRSSTRRATLVVAWLSATSLVLALPGEARAAPASESAAESPESNSAESIFRRGEIKYETADYLGAITLWTEAYGLVESTPENAAIQALLIFNLAQAHVKAFEIDDDVIHLKTARSLLDSYRTKLDLLYDDDAARADEQARVDEKLAEIAAKLDEVEAAKPAPEPAPEPEPEPEPKVDVPPATPPHPGNPLLFAGVGITVLGVATGGVALGVGAAMASKANDVSGLDPLDLVGREEQFARGMRGNALMITGAVVAGVLIPTGIALIVAGASRNGKAKRGDQAHLPTLAPGFGRGQAGIVISGRF